MEGEGLADSTKHMMTQLLRLLIRSLLLPSLELSVMVLAPLGQRERVVQPWN